MGLVFGLIICGYFGVLKSTIQTDIETDKCIIMVGLSNCNTESKHKYLLN